MLSPAPEGFVVATVALDKLIHLLSTDIVIKNILIDAALSF